MRTCVNTGLLLSGADALPRELRLKLTNKFLSFCEARASIRRRMESYVLDYQLRDAGTAHKYERLEELYAADCPDPMLPLSRSLLALDLRSASG